ncbi:KilA-N domain-containing protein [Aspergillus ibericus CBS 121593]|uniref:Cell pattern formation-associated protein stuA n=1 Tax=Aspergillus ibericus CBS 121593 TaxID=1448316 RepID=A0A395GU84_9EURO|nr:DNA-binding domain of Mlu1-box binding protein MBP1 [Aspergillus ibericus CBS 121593]RAK99026.1 DNA-binding domain of Mlu1-box binding protein MBP1 [Aspergillus ibericus CBS 121593]
MVRSLPKKNNPLILTDVAPAYDELLSRRRLGKTNLAVKPTQVGTSNATKPENLGPFEYAHLRAPLPRDLKGSEIFPSHSPQQHPETYFLMRRSKDGFVSATGMFKIAFPWAKLDEERSEREYLKSRTETSEDEIAGNVWISPLLALELAKEYQMYDWVRALLDPTDIVQSPSSAKKQITPPPRFDLPPIEAPAILTASSTRLRRGRSASPSKKLSSPRKPRQTRAMKEANAAATSAANASLQSSLDLTASTAETESVTETVHQSVEVDGDEKPAPSPKKSASASKSRKIAARVQPSEEPEKEEKEEGEEEEKVKVDVETNAESVDDLKTTQTTVSVEMPITLPEAPSAAETEQMIAKAKEMVQEAVKLQTETEEPSSAKAAKKRKTEVLSDDEDEEEDEETKTLRVKRAKVLEEKLKQERVRNRALVGVTAAFALAASIPYFF